MSILIKGMEMPTNCAECKMYVDDIYCCHLLQRQIENPWADDGVETDCPLAPVPKHGKLGDLDRLAKEVEDMGKEFPPDSIGAERYRLFAEFIKTAPTILEAEEGET